MKGKGSTGPRVEKGARKRRDRSEVKKEGRVMVENRAGSHGRNKK